jgi:hypothetical protein
MSNFSDCPDDEVVLDYATLDAQVWPNRTVADRTLRQGVPNLPGFAEVAYQPKGPKMKRRTAWFDLGRIQDPYAWIAYRLGPIKPL